MRAEIYVTASGHSRRNIWLYSQSAQWERYNKRVGYKIEREREGERYNERER